MINHCHHETDTVVFDFRKLGPRCLLVPLSLKFGLSLRLGEFVALGVAGEMLAVKIAVPATNRQRAVESAHLARCAHDNHPGHPIRCDA